MKRILMLLAMSLLLCSCGDTKTDDSLNKNNPIGGNSGEITCIKMKDLVKDEDAILIDVRTESEYNENHLDGAINLNYETIEKTIVTKVKEKDKPIVVYCRSGQRSSVAKSKLVELGYTNVYDLGSIENCTK